MGTPASSATTRCSRAALTPARSCTCVCARGQANTQRGALRFVDELIARVRRAGAAGEILVRADSGFWNKKVMRVSARQGCRFSIGVTMHKIVTALIALIPDDAWQPVADYPDTGVCELAETTLGEDRLIVRRVHLHAQEDQASCSPTGAITRSSPTAPSDAPRRRRAPPARPGRTRHPRPQRPGARALPVRALQRQQRLDRDRVPRAQPRPLDQPARPHRPHTPGRRHAAPPPVCAPRSAHPQPRDARRCTSPPAGPGRPTSSKRSPASERSPPPDSPTDTETDRPAPRVLCDARNPENGAADTPPPAIKPQHRSQPLPDTPTGSSQPPSPPNTREPHKKRWIEA